MERSDIEALRTSVGLLRAGTDGMVAMAQAGPRVMTSRTRDELRGAAHHIDEYLSRGEAVSGDGFTIVTT